MICKNCGRSNADGTKYCIKCGKNLGTAPTPPPAPQTADGIDMSRTAPVYAPPQAGNVFKTEENKNMSNGNYYPPAAPPAAAAPMPVPVAAGDEIRLANARPSYFLAILCFFNPLMGFIIWLQWKGVSKKVSKPYGIATLISFLICAVTIIAGGIVMAVMFETIVTTITDFVKSITEGGLEGILGEGSFLM